VYYGSTRRWKMRATEVGECTVYYICSGYGSSSYGQKGKLLQTCGCGAKICVKWTTSTLTFGTVSSLNLKHTGHIQTYLLKTPNGEIFVHMTTEQRAALVQRDGVLPSNPERKVGIAMARAECGEGLSQVTRSTICCGRQIKSGRKQKSMKPSNTSLLLRVLP
jgi:hypothetical protein